MSIKTFEKSKLFSLFIPADAVFSRYRITNNATDLPRAIETLAPYFDKSYFPPNPAAGNADLQSFRSRAARLESCFAPFVAAFCYPPSV